MTAEQHDDTGAFELLVHLLGNSGRDVTEDVRAILHDGLQQPLEKERLRALLIRLVTRIPGRVVMVDEFVDSLLEDRRLETIMKSSHIARSNVVLIERNGIRIQTVCPTQRFLNRSVPLTGGYVKTTQIDLWADNDRLEIHTAQFRGKFGRAPDDDELLQIMLGSMTLPGVEPGDQFEIVALANSIAENGVRRPPIIDRDGTLLDGNRRVASCYYILNSDRFTTEQKKRVEYIYVWQLTETATEEDRESIVISLNFEPDYKLAWPEYVKARKVYDAYESAVALEGRAPTQERQRTIRRELAQKFGYGTDTRVVDRYIKMVNWANEFEEHHINVRKRDEYAVKHRTNERFQYFDELQKGTASGVAHVLTLDDTLRETVFDLLYDGKFKNWALVRNLKHCTTQDSIEELRKAAANPDIDEATDTVEEILTAAKSRSRGLRVRDIDTEIERFVKILEDLPVSAFRDVVTIDNLSALLRAFELVELQAKKVLGKRDGAHGSER